jgi:hypothetical protein
MTCGQKIGANANLVETDWKSPDAVPRTYDIDTGDGQCLESCQALKRSGIGPHTKAVSTELATVALTSEVLNLLLRKLLRQKESHVRVMLRQVELRFGGPSSASRSASAVSVPSSSVLC